MNPYQMGRKAARQKEPYGANPFPEEGPARLAWSKGHNAARVDSLRALARA